MPDLADAFWQEVESTAEAMKRKGAAPQAFAPSDGPRVSGWVLEETHESKVVGEVSRNTWYEDSSSSTAYILGTDGKLYFESRRQKTTPEGTENSHVIISLETRHVVGDQGEPFSEFGAMLRRLPYRY